MARRICPTTERYSVCLDRHSSEELRRVGFHSSTGFAVHKKPHLLKKKVPTSNDLDCNLLLVHAVECQNDFSKRALHITRQFDNHLPNTRLDGVPIIQTFVQVIAVVLYIRDLGLSWNHIQNGECTPVFVSRSTGCGCESSTSMYQHERTKEEPDSHE